MQSSGHVALITGGATGIGLALARTFLHHGNQVILVGRRESALHAAAALLPGAVICVADVSVPEDRERLVALFPHVTVLVNNAGTQVYKAIEASTPQEIENEIAVIGMRMYSETCQESQPEVTHDPGENHELEAYIAAVRELVPDAERWFVANDYWHSFSVQQSAERWQNHVSYSKGRAAR